MRARGDAAVGPALLFVLVGTRGKSARGGARKAKAAAPEPGLDAGGHADYLIWQLCDSAFPTGGFAHSAGLEAACHHGEIRGREALGGYLEASLWQFGHASLPFMNAAFGDPAAAPGVDDLCDSFTSNHVANRASRAQGRALRLAVERIFLAGDNPEAEGGLPPELPFGHLATTWGCAFRALGLSRATAGRAFAFNHLRALLAAAVRLNVVGPMEAQGTQRRLGGMLGRVLAACDGIPPQEAAQTSPLIEIWQAGHDRLYSRLFQS